MSATEPAVALRLRDWDRPADAADGGLLALCVGPTLDIGCGPGRLTLRLAELGRVVLGIDVLGEAVGRARARGAAALQRDVFEAVPGEGRWRTALLADGNVGIGGDPPSLLRRIRQVLDPRGRVVVELAPPGVDRLDDWAVLAGEHGARVLPWSIVGMDHIDDVAASAGLGVARRRRVGERWCAVLEDLP